MIFDIFDILLKLAHISWPNGQIASIHYNI
jgi:hypothetical protein